MEVYIRLKLENSLKSLGIIVKYQKIKSYNTVDFWTFRKAEKEKYPLIALPIGI